MLVEDLVPEIAAGFLPLLQGPLGWLVFGVLALFIVLLVVIDNEDFE